MIFKVTDRSSQTAADREGTEHDGILPEVELDIYVAGRELPHASVQVPWAELPEGTQTGDVLELVKVS